MHRDLKPENVFLARRPNGSRTVKVLDFGISKLMVIGSAQQRSLTQTSTIMGSPLYMSPEQMRTPRDVDARSDIWALGAILYELLGGRPPFIADSIPQLCALLVESTPLPVRQLRPEVPEELEQVVARCLSKSVDARWPTVRELARALLPFASFESQVDAARIGRMRGTTDAPMVGQGTLASASPATSPLPTGKPAELAGAAVPEPALTTLPAPAESGDPVMHPTQHTWGATRPPGREGKRWPWVAGAAILVVTVMLVLWGRIRAPSAVGASDAQKSASPAPPTLPATRAAVQPERSSHPTAVSATTSGATLHAPAEERSRRDGDQAIAAAPGEPAATPAGTTPAPSPKPSERAGPSDHARKNAAPAAPSPARAKPSTDVGLTDFGGRR